MGRFDSGWPGRVQVGNMQMKHPSSQTVRWRRGPRMMLEQRKRRLRLQHRGHDRSCPVLPRTATCCRKRVGDRFRTTDASKPFRLVHSVRIAPDRGGGGTRWRAASKSLAEHATPSSRLCRAGAWRLRSCLRWAASPAGEMEALTTVAPGLAMGIALHVFFSKSMNALFPSTEVVDGYAPMVGAPGRPCCAVRDNSDDCPFCVSLLLSMRQPRC